MAKSNTHHSVQIPEYNKCVVKDRLLSGEICVVVITAVKASDNNWTGSLLHRRVVKAQLSLYSLSGAIADRIHKRKM